MSNACQKVNSPHQTFVKIKMLRSATLMTPKQHWPLSSQGRIKVFGHRIKISSKSIPLTTNKGSLDVLCNHICWVETVVNYRIIARYLGVVALMLAASTLVSVPWALPSLNGADSVESRSIQSLFLTMAGSSFVGLGLHFWGRKATGRLYRREALAVVGLSWCFASVIGAMPYWLSGTCKGPAIEGASARGEPMTITDAVFESASGFSGTGATVITDLEDSDLVPRAILFWRSQTHFLGGLGIMVLFVALLGQGSEGKAVMRAEVPGPHEEMAHARVQHAALAFTGVYVGLNVILTILLLLEGMSLFDAMCHSFGTIATGGFSTYNSSVAHFESVAIEMTITLFMAISCVNFTLLFSVVVLQPQKLYRDVEVRTYVGILVLSTLAVVLFGLGHGDFSNVPEALRYSLFQVTSILTNTGFGTHDFDEWNEFARGLLFLLMFVGGCAGSTSCSIKVIRHILFWKVLSREVEKSYRPTVVRPLRIGSDTVGNEVGNHVLFYFGLIAFTFVSSWVGLLLIEPDAGWTGAGLSIHEKFIDCATGVAATLNGVGPGLGTIGATKNYAHFQPASKLLLSALMLLGRLEMIPLIVLFMPRFWRG
jgi:trk system potassium uptake protein TrkH